jgi:YidC/Oxa1 family membrane protein insertase
MIDFIYNLIIFPITQIIDFSFGFSQKVFKETWISIVFVSLTVSILCLPLYIIAEKIQEAERAIQKKMKPKIDKIRAVFKGDERYMITSVFYRQNHYHPVFALRSALSLIIQIPFFIAAYIYLSHLEVLNGVHFYLIKDLSLPDGLIRIGGIRLNVLPLLMTLLNLSSGIVYSKGFPLKDKLQLTLTSLFFLIILYNSPSALVLYWTMNNFFSLFKNLYYKINYAHKKIALLAFFSAVLFLFVYYILFTHQGDPQQRSFLSFAVCFTALVPWILYILKKIPRLDAFNLTDTRSVFPVFLLSFLILCVLSGLLLPSLLIASSPEEFSYIDDKTTPLFFIFNVFSQSIGFFVLWPAGIYFLFSQKAKNYFSLLGLVLCAGALINSFIFTGNYGFVSVDLRFLDGVNHNSVISNLNAFILGISALLCLVIFHFRFRKILIPVLSICLAALLGISTVNIVRINNSFLRFASFHSIVSADNISTEPFFTLSRKGKNTIVIMLDRATSSFFPFILEESPDLKTKYSGFIYYPNTVSFNGYTKIGAPPVFGGYEYTPEEINKRDKVPLLVKHNEALLLLPRIFSEAGFSVTVTDPPYPNYSNKNEDLTIYEGFPVVQALLTDGLYTNLWIKEHGLNFPLISDILKRNIFWYSLFRISPVITRRGIYQYGDWCSAVPGQRIRLFLNGYAVLDYLPRLCSINDNDENTLLLMVNNTTHEGAILQEPDYLPALNVSHFFPGPFNRETEYHINIAAYKRLGLWFEFLKNEGVYDNTRIILVSDHGSQTNHVTKRLSTMPANIDNFNPILFVRDFNAQGELNTDMSFMTNADVPFLALNGQIENPVNPFTGNAVSVKNKENPLYIAVSESVLLENPNGTIFRLNPKKDYYVHGGIFEEKNWSRVEK